LVKIQLKLNNGKPILSDRKHTQIQLDSHESHFSEKG
jgi:hypothetical protein